MSDLPSFTARVLSADGRTRGTAFAVHSSGLLATGAHVIQAAGAGPGRVVQIAFAHGQARPALVEPEYWRAEDAEDVAVLRLEDGLPDGVAVPALGTSTGRRGQRFHTYGFPEAKPVEGLHGYGELGDPIRDEGGSVVLQLTHTTETSPGFSGAPVAVGDEGAEVVVGMVTSITSPDRFGRLTETAFCTPAEVLRSVCPDLQISAVCPFRSLEAFTEEQAAFFFGRDAVIRRLLEALRRQPRFLAVLGPSGSGKSSVVKAGLLPRLRQGALEGSRHWSILVTRPAALYLLEPQLPGADEDLMAAVQAWARGGGEPSHLLLVLDQFEEVFSVGGTRASALLAGLPALLDSSLPVSVVLTLRDDFYSRVARDAPALMHWIEGGLGNVSPTLTREEVRAIVEAPAGAVGLRFEEGLIDRIVDDALAAGSGPGTEPSTTRSTVLPLLEFALTQLWELREEGVLRLADYQRLGGVTGTLGQWADTTYYRLDDGERAIAREVLTRLVSIGDEAEAIPHSRRRLSLASLSGGSENEEAVHTLVSRLATARLLVTGRDDHLGEEIVELVHDALIREWELLRRWIRADTEFLGWYQEMESRARAWVASQSDGTETRDEGRLLRGRELAEARQFLQEREAELNAAVREYVIASIEASERDQRHIEDLKARAAMEREEAERARELASRREARARLGMASERVMGLLRSNPVEGLVLAIDTMGRNLDELPGDLVGSVRASLYAAVHFARERRSVFGHTATVTAVAFASNGRSVVSASADRTLRLWDAEGNPLGPPLTGHEDVVTAVAVSGDGRTIASGSEDGTLRLWRPDTGGPALWSAPHGDAVSVVAFTPDGLIVSACLDGNLRLWRWQESGIEALRVFDEGAPVLALAVSPDGHLFASGREDGTLHLCDGHGEVRFQSLAHATGVDAIAFSPDGRTIVSGGRDNRIRLWAESGVPAADPLVGHEGWVTTLSVSPDGACIVSGSTDRSVRFWDRHSPGDSIVLMGHTSHVNRIVLPGGGRTIVSGSADGTLRSWNWDGAQLGSPWRGHTSFIYDVALSPDGETVVSASADTTLCLWDRQGNRLCDPFVGHKAAVNAVAFSPDGQTIVSGGADRVLWMWSREGKPLRGPLVAHTDEVWAVEYAPDGERFVSAGADRMLRFWDRDGNLLGHTSTLHEGEVRALAASPTRLTSASGAELLIASGSQDGTVRLWTWEGQAVGTPFVGNEGGVFAVAFTRGGDMLLTGCGDGTLRLWSREGDLVAELRGHLDSVWTATASPDGRRFVSGGADASVRVWFGGDYEDWLAAACRRMRLHPALTLADTEEAKRACATCRTRVWDQSPP